MKVEYNYLSQQFPEDELLSNIKYEDANITTRILWRIADVAKRGDFTLGSEVEEFEQAWASVQRSRFAVGMSNGTDAIAIALQAAGLVPGDEVLTSPVSFIATTGAIVQAGGKPIFMDVESYLEPNIRARYAPTEAKWAVPVMWAGSPQFLDEWDRSDFKVVVDAAQGMNAAIFGGNPLAESLPNVYAFTYSLHPLKNINVWGDGGVIATNDIKVDTISRSLRNHGLAGRDGWERFGYNSRLSTMQAAVGLEVLPTWGAMDRQRQINARQLTAGIEDIEGIHAPFVDEAERHAWHLYQIVLDEEFNRADRDRLVKMLEDEDVEVKVHYPIPLHLQEATEMLGYKRGDFPNAERFCDLHITLPIHEYLDEDDMEYTLDVLGRMMKEIRDTR